jgi:hypothetical protein
MASFSVGVRSQGKVSTFLCCQHQNFIASGKLHQYHSCTNLFVRIACTPYKLEFTFGGGQSLTQTAFTKTERNPRSRKERKEESFNRT